MISKTASGMKLESNRDSSFVSNPRAHRYIASATASRGAGVGSSAAGRVYEDDMLQFCQRTLDVVNASLIDQKWQLQSLYLEQSRFLTLRQVVETVFLMIIVLNLMYRWGRGSGGSLLGEERDTPQEYPPMRRIIMAIYIESIWTEKYNRPQGLNPYIKDLMITTPYTHDLTDTVAPSAPQSDR